MDDRGVLIETFRTMFSTNKEKKPKAIVTCPPAFSRAFYWLRSLPRVLIGSCHFLLSLFIGCIRVFDFGFTTHN